MLRFGYAVRIPSFLLKPPRKGKGTRCGAVSEHSVANSSLCQKAVKARTAVFSLPNRESHCSLKDGGCGAKYIYFSEVLRFGCAVRIPLFFCRLPARERVRGAARSASIAWPIPHLSLPHSNSFLRPDDSLNCTKTLFCHKK